MSRQSYNIFSPPLSPFPVDLIEDNIYEIDSEHERILQRFSEMFNSDFDDISTSSSIDFEDFENFEDFEDFEDLGEVKEQEICDDKDEIIDHSEQTRFTPCVIVDFIN